ncbi:MAG: hypothetical protein JRI23_10895 [Deltaproteobacteria bacterium]|nr:hypothetical protein [Deltaproteobacteria bacterium]MBW2532188.1 hypothetical protein [Deltaproteobacteria bacterium]
MPIDIDYTLGCFYMPKPSYPSHQWISVFIGNQLDRIKELRGQRMPVLGYYQGDSPLVLDWQIKYAVERGIRFWIFDDYWTEHVDEPVYDTSIRAFMAAEYRELMTFAMMVTSNSTVEWNHASKRERFLSRIIPYYVQHYLGEPNYLVVDGRPFIHIYHTSPALGTMDPGEIRSTLEEADAYISANTSYPGAYWAVGHIQSSTVDFSNEAAAGFDCVSPYYVLPHLFPSSAWPITTPETGINQTWPVGVPYSDLAAHAKITHGEGYVAAAAVGLDFISAAAPDFDSRKNYWVNEHLYFDGQNANDYWSMLSNLKGHVDANAASVPVCDNTGRRMVGLGPWNEQVESSTIEPGHSALNLNSADMSPFYMATAAAKVFGGPADYDETIPGDLSRGFPAITEWTFQSPAGAGLELWHTSVTSSLRIDLDDTAALQVDDGNGMMATVTNLASNQYARLLVQLQLTDGGPLGNVHLRWLGSDYSTSAHEFASPLEPGHQAHAGLMPSTTVTAAGDFEQHEWDLSSSPDWAGQIYYFELRLVPVAGGHPMRVRVKRFWLEP